MSDEGKTPDGIFVSLTPEVMEAVDRIRVIRGCSRAQVAREHILAGLRRDGEIDQPRVAEVA